MKKNLFIITLLSITCLICGCKKTNTLYVLNWGEYINGDLVMQFEKENNCKVELVINDSNEGMYTVIADNQYPIDIAIPSDYMIQKLYKDNLLNAIDFSKLENYQEGVFDDELDNLRKGYFTNSDSYYLPYFWGSTAIMYNDRTPGLEALIKTNGWASFFDESVYTKAGIDFSSVKVGMYNNPRDAIATAELYLNINVNTTDDTLLQNVENTLVNQKKKLKSGVKYLSDDLKKYVSGGKNLDFAMVYSGDFFDQLYILKEDGSKQYINCYVPETSNVYFDGMVIPKTSKQTELAYKFLDFFLNKDNVLANVDYVGYCPALESAYNTLKDDTYQEGYWSQIIKDYPSFYPGNVKNKALYYDLGDSVYEKMNNIYLKVASVS